MKSGSQPVLDNVAEKSSLLQITGPEESTYGTVPHDTDKGLEKTKSAASFNTTSNLQLTTTLGRNVSQETKLLSTSTNLQ